MEPVYPGSTDVLLKECITFSAIECAKKLKVPLVRQFKNQEKKEGEKGYEYLLGTINGPAPFEHFDGLSLQVKNNNTYDKVSTSSYFGWIDGSEIKLIFDPKNDLGAYTNPQKYH